MLWSVESTAYPVCFFGGNGLHDAIARLKAVPSTRHWAKFLVGRARRARRQNRGQNH